MILDTFVAFLILIQYVFFCFFHFRHNLDVLGFCLGIIENVLGVLGTFGFFCDICYNLGHFGMF